jgi:5'-phosphate synthase pdxT subunit
MLIGVLALQGGFEPHLQALQRLSIPSIQVRTPADLSQTDALILPGGESTTLMRQLDYAQLLEPLRNYPHPLFVTCAGLIICSHSRIDSRYMGLGLLDIDVDRNAYGSQVDSFAIDTPFPALFIRAPKISRLGPSVQVLATYDNSPILIAQGPHLAMTCHPELTNDLTLYRQFVQNVTRREPLSSSL